MQQEKQHSELARSPTEEDDLSTAFFPLIWTQHKTLNWVKRVCNNLSPVPWVSCNFPLYTVGPMQIFDRSLTDIVANI